jgi:hypothetical protein
MVVYAVETCAPHDRFRKEGCCQCLVRILPTWHLQPLQRNDPARAPTGTARRARSMDANEKVVFNLACEPFHSALRVRLRHQLND